MPVVLLDPTQTGLNILPMGRVGISDPGALNSYARVFGLPCAGWPETTLGLVTHSTQMVQKKGANLEAQRTMVVYKRGLANAAGANIVWTPAAGLRFRLLGFDVQMGGNCTLAAAGPLQVDIRDGALQVFIWAVYVNNAVIVGTGSYLDKTIVFGQNGYLSAAANNVLTCFLGAALAAGSIGVTAWGNEEI